MGPRLYLWFSACKTGWLVSESLVSMGPSPHVWFLDAKQRLMDRNNKSLWVPDITCRCVHENSVIRTRISSLYVSQTASVVLSTHNCVLNTKIKRLYWFQLSPVVLCMQNSDFRTRITSLCGSKPNLWFLRAKQRILDLNNKSLWIPDMTFRFVHVQQRD